MTTVSGEACPLTGQPASITSGEFDGWTVTGPYTDGTYGIARSVIAQTRSLQPSHKAKVVSWIVDRHRAGDREPLVGSQTLEQVRDKPALTYDQRVDRLFMLLRKIDFGFGRALRVAGVVDQDYTSTVGRLSAWLEFPESNKVGAFLNVVVTEGLLTYDGSHYRLTAQGARRLDELSNPNTGSRQAFVAMWFAPEMTAAFDQGFEPAIEANGFRALRIDRKEHNNKIDDEIISEIRRSRFVVADFTCGLIKADNKLIGIPRGGVYYEAGFAQGLKIDVIWTVRADCIDHVHFDTRQYAHVVWDNEVDLKRKLQNRIGAVIGQAEL